MISLTRLNGKAFVLNAELIRTVEEVPDTTITLTSGDRMLVRENADEVVERAVAYGRLLRAMLPSDYTAPRRAAQWPEGVK